MFVPYTHAQDRMESPLGIAPIHSKAFSSWQKSKLLINMNRTYWLWVYRGREVARNADEEVILVLGLLGQAEEFGLYPKVSDKIQAIMAAQKWESLIPPGARGEGNQRR